MGIAEMAIAAGEAEPKRLGMMDSDPVNHPQHYIGFSNGAEVIDITENLTFNAGNAVKYAARAGRTDGRNKGAVVEDLNKAIWYLRRELERLGETNES